ncbi:MAG: endo-1,3-alpha-glucanase family glycosylhydrolase [Candidatus Korobacteraceae bacterium]|jgi:hypothetical protein
MQTRRLPDASPSTCRHSTPTRPTARRGSRWGLLALAAAALLLEIACGKADLQKTLRTTGLQAADGGPVVLAAYQPWFGRSGHIDVGYSSQDRTVLEHQIEEAKRLGISGFVVNWYGQRHRFEDQSYSLMQRLAGETGFKVAIMYDEDESSAGDTTGAVINDLQYAYDHYIGPKADTPSRSYLRYQGHPVIFIFPKQRHTDWNRVRAAVNGWEVSPLLIYKDPYIKFASAFDGFYAWVSPGKPGWKADGSNWGEQYLEHFYVTMNKQYPDKLVVGAAWPGFNDARASWSLNRHMDPRCGRTFEDSLRVFRRYYPPEHPLPFLMIVTWNDYEEGTAIERGTNCKTAQTETPSSVSAAR